MCSVILLRTPGAAWPLVLAGNRDEMADRPWKAPGRHWPDRPNVVAGLDELAGGSWMGLNDEGMLAVALNRMGTLGPETGKRSRGELVLDALDHADAADAAMALSHLDTRAYRPFHLVLADNRDAFLLVHRGEGGGGEGGRNRPEVIPIGEGVHMLTAAELNDTEDPRIGFYLPLFRGSVAPTVEAAGADSFGWGGWPELLGSRIWDDRHPERGERSAMSFRLPTGFGTVSSSLVALPAIGRPELKPIWHFAGGPPHATPFEPVALR
ncbi:NRDE family protein [Azospirillum sp. SYSU D00513]|uniref:NRDE family protein n=1 Tax=Azospirillum sp. SYSU D00513 TaxID=2812561 RepID=UPI001A96FEB6|nr:NRDE family protein [Azospirillum sp. SYSU D00513]